LIDQTLTWNDIAWLRKNTTMKIVVKGVMTVEDALASVKHGKSYVHIDVYGYAFALQLVRLSNFVYTLIF
jgi:(S)-2-hydroxy-acid oxidase